MGDVGDACETWEDAWETWGDARTSLIGTLREAIDFENNCSLNEHFGRTKVMKRLDIIN